MSPGGGPRPPRIAERLLGRVLPSHHREFVLGDLHEEYARRARARGARRAGWWYCGQVAAAVLPALRRRAQRSAGTHASRTNGRSRMSVTELMQEFRLAARSMRRRPAQAVLVVATLGLAVGTAAATFAVVDGVLLRELPYPGAGRIVSLSELHPERMQETGWSSVPNSLDWEARAASFEAVALFRGRSMALTGEGDPLYVYGAFASPDFFHVFGSPPALGRTFVEGDDVAGAEPVVILSHGLWQRRFGGDESVVGARVMVDGVARTVVGIMPRGFAAPAEWIGPGTAMDLWIPFVVDVTEQARGNRSYNTVARLRPSATLANAVAEMRTISGALRSTYPDDNDAWQLRVLPWREMVVGGTRRAVLLMFGAVTLLLVVAAANAGNLVLNQWLARGGELSVRAALGAGRMRLVRGVVLEALLAGTLSGAVGLACAGVLLAALRALDPGTVPRLAEVSLDGRVAAVTVAGAIAAALLSALIPMLFAARAAPAAASAVRAQGGAPGGTPLRARSMLAVAQMAVALALLIGSTLALRGFLRLRAVEPGFAADGVLTATVALSWQRVSTIEQRAAYVGQVLERLRALPGVHDAAMINSLPFSGSHSQQTFAIAGVASAIDAQPYAGMRGISPDYAATMRIPLRGRELSAADLRGDPAVALVNEALVRRYFGGEEALGRRLLLAGGELQVEVVGVVGDVHHFSLDRAATPEIYLPYTADFLTSKSFVVRTDGDPYAFVSAVRRAILDVDPQQPLRAAGGAEAISLRDLVATSLAGVRFQTFVLLLLATLSIGVSGAGLFAVLSRLVTERRREIGIRMALGAARRNVLLWILGRTARLTGLAALLGVALSVSGGRALEALLFEVSVRDPLTFGAALVVFLSISIVACAMPAVRATRLDPASALRE